MAVDPMHGMTLEMILERLVGHYGWPTLGRKIDIRCFTTDPSIKSSLKFLRKTPWARAKVEALYRELPTATAHHAQPEQGGGKQRQ